MAGEFHRGASVEAPDTGLGESGDLGRESEAPAEPRARNDAVWWQRLSRSFALPTRLRNYEG